MFFDCVKDFKDIKKQRCAFRCHVVTRQNWIERWIKEYFLKVFKETKIRAKRFLKDFKNTIQVCKAQTRERGKAILDPKNMCEESHNFRLGYKILDKV